MYMLVGDTHRDCQYSLTKTPRHHCGQFWGKSSTWPVTPVDLNGPVHISPGSHIKKRWPCIGRNGGGELCNLTRITREYYVMLIRHLLHLVQIESAPNKTVTRHIYIARKKNNKKKTDNFQRKVWLLWSGRVCLARPMVHYAFSHYIRSTPPVN